MKTYSITRFLPLLLLFVAGSSDASNEAPTLSSSGESMVEVSDGTMDITAQGGSTEEPPNDRGCPPWTKTGNCQFAWYIETVETVDDETLVTTPGNSETTTSPTLTIDLKKAGSIKIRVSLQEEYQDSSDNPVTLYWPE